MITFEAPAIRAEFRTGQYTKAELARKYNCHPETITNILNRTEDQDVYVRTKHLDNLLIMPYLDYIRGLLKKVHTAVSSGSWCGGQRQQCGDSGSGLR